MHCWCIYMVVSCWWTYRHCRWGEEAYTLQLDRSTCIRIHVDITVMASAAAVWSELVVLPATVCRDWCSPSVALHTLHTILMAYAAAASCHRFQELLQEFAIAWNGNAVLSLPGHKFLT